MGAVAADLYVATDRIGVPGRGGEREEVGVPEVDPHPIREAEPDPEARPDAIRIGDAGGPVRIVRDRRLVVGGAEAEAPPARRLVAGADRVAEAVLPPLGLDDRRLLRVLEVEDELVELRPVRPRDVAQEGPAGRELVEGAEGDAVGEVERGVPVRIDEGTGEALQDRRLLRDLEAGTSPEPVMSVRAVGEPDAGRVERAQQDADVVTRVPVVTSEHVEPVDPLRPQAGDRNAARSAGRWCRGRGRW